MTTPEENTPKTDDTEQAGTRPDGNTEQEPRREPDTRRELGAELEDRMAEKGLSRDDFTGS